MKKFRVKNCPKDLRPFGLKDGDTIEVADEDNYLSNSPTHPSVRAPLGHVLFLTPLGQWAYLLEHEIVEVKDQANVERHLGEF
nr:MAG: hypothetical protein [Microvirus sp.]